MNLRKLRVAVAAVVLVAATLLFLDFSGTVHPLLGWLAKVQLLPAIMAANVVVVVAVVALTLIFGRLYCSVICPLGILQDLLARIGLKQKKNRYSYSSEKRIVRLAVLLAATCLWSFAYFLDPYSIFGRIATTLFAPVWQGLNNLLAWGAGAIDSYAFYAVPIHWAGWCLSAISVALFVVIAVLAYRNGRTWCNTICPVGTLLGYLARFSWLRPVIDTSKCNNCGLCARNCKASCIDAKNHAIDLTRCVVCFDCIDKCNRGAISYAPRRKKAVEAAPADAPKGEEKNNLSRRQFLAVSAALTASAVATAQEQKVDGGLATLIDKKIPARKRAVVPAGSRSYKLFTKNCTACQLCVAVCPNEVLRPSSKLERLMQPEMGFEKGYCRPECTKCSEVCPAGAILPITREEKSSEQIGHAVWVRENCLAVEGVKCDNCARHCPTGAIQMVEKDGKRIPAVDTEKCIGCGACENLCPARPFSAIYVEGNEVHRTL
ncbi:MAG: 4Fe-4S binding protein [Rikenellaceae bacterium]|nr:4Fe-4S binding protein [Rikenellaceae bacterium]